MIFGINTIRELYFIQIICYSDRDISYESKAQCLHFLVVYIVNLCLIFKIDTGADNTWYPCTLLVQKLTLFASGVPHVEVKFHVLGLPV